MQLLQANGSWKGTLSSENGRMLQTRSSGFYGKGEVSFQYELFESLLITNPSSRVRKICSKVSHWSNSLRRSMHIAD